MLRTVRGIGLVALFVAATGLPTVAQDTDEAWCTGLVEYLDAETPLQVVGPVADAVLDGCKGYLSASGRPPAAIVTTDVALTDAELSWCLDWIPAIYRVGLRIGAAPPSDLPTVQAIERELLSKSEQNDDWRFSIFSLMPHDKQQALEDDWKRVSAGTYNRACKVAFEQR